MKIREYIGPFGAGKTTLCQATMNRLESDGAEVFSREDYRNAIANVNDAEKCLWLAKHFPRFTLLLATLCLLCMNGKMADRFRRAGNVAKMAVYYREFASSRSGVLYMDEGIINGLCSCLMGGRRFPGKWTFRLLYGGLEVEFIWVSESPDECVRRIIQRTRTEGRKQESEFLRVLYSGDPKKVGEVVRFANKFYGKVLPCLREMFVISVGSLSPSDCA